MLRDAVKLGLVTVVGLGVVATVGVGVGVVTLVAGAIFAGVSSAEPPRDDTKMSNEGFKPKVEEKKMPKQGKPTLPQEKRPSESTKKQTSQPTTDTTLESKFGRSPQSKNSAPNGRDERKTPTPVPTNIESKPDHTPESKYSSPNGRDERKAPTPTPNRQRSASVVVIKPVDTTTTSKEAAPRVGSSNGTALPDKPSSLSRELEAQITPEVKHWRNERPSNQETKKRGIATGRDISEKPSLPELGAKTETVSVPEPSASASVNAPGPLPLLPPSHIPKPESTPHLSEAILEPQSKPETTAAVPIIQEKHTPSENTSQDEASLSTPGDCLPAPLISSKLDMSPPLPPVPAQDSRSEAPLTLRATEDQRHPDVSPPSIVPVVSVPVEESADLAADAMLASTLSMKLEAEPLDLSSNSTTTITSTVAPNGFDVLQGSASASRDSLVSVQRRNSKLTSAAKKVSHSVKKVFKGPNGKVIYPDSQRLTSSSSDSVDSQRFSIDHDQGLPNGRALSKLASSSRESLVSTKSRRSLVDGTKKGLKRMFRGPSDNIEVPPVPPLPSLASATPEGPISSENPAVVPSTSTPVSKPAKFFSPKSALPSQQHQQQAHASVSNAPQSTRNAPGTPEAGNNASPLLKGMFKGRTNTRVRR